MTCDRCENEIASSADYDPADDRLAMFLYGLALGIATAGFAFYLSGVRL